MKPPSYLKIDTVPGPGNTVTVNAKFVRWRFALMVARMGLRILAHAAGVLVRGARTA